MRDVSSSFLAVLFADVCGSVSLYETIGDAAAQALVKSSLQTMAAITQRHRGRLIGSRGDDILGVFPTANLAFAAALEMQDAHRRGAVAIKVGISVGPVIEEAGDVFGDAANTAARVTALARAGEILMTEETIQLLDAPHVKATRLFDTTTVRGKAKPVRIYCATSEEETQATQLWVGQERAAVRGGCHVLLLSHGPGSRLRLEREAQTAVLGRESECDIIIDSRYASRRHAVVTAKRDKFTLTDISTNGTFVLNQDNDIVFLKREALTLQGQGLIFLGAQPSAETATAVAYRCLSMWSMVTSAAGAVG